jgi:hypothetical protein
VKECKKLPEKFARNCLQQFNSRHRHGKTICGISFLTRRHTTMASKEDIQYQRELLKAHRATLRDLIMKEAMFGKAHTPPYITNGICEARANIARIKDTLDAWGVFIPDAPGDIAPASLSAHETSAVAQPWIEELVRQFEYAKGAVTGVFAGVTLDEVVRFLKSSGVSAEQVIGRTGRGTAQ